MVSLENTGTKIPWNLPGSAIYQATQIQPRPLSLNGGHELAQAIVVLAIVDQGHGFFRLGLAGYIFKIDAHVEAKLFYFAEFEMVDEDGLQGTRAVDDDQGGDGR